MKSSKVEWHFTMVTMKEKRSIVRNTQPVQIDGYSQSFVATVKFRVPFQKVRPCLNAGFASVFWFCCLFFFVEVSQHVPGS